MDATQQQSREKNARQHMLYLQKNCNIRHVNHRRTLQLQNLFLPPSYMPSADPPIGFVHSYTGTTNQREQDEISIIKNDFYPIIKDLSAFTLSRPSIMCGS